VTGKLGVFSLGYTDLSQVLNGHFLWQAAGFLVLAKLAATIISYGLGGSGGIFSPLLFLGGMSGFFVAGLFGQWLPLNSSDVIVLSAVGMSACLSAVLRTPLLALLIVFEMTHEFSMVPGLMIGLAVSMLVGRLAGQHNFYDELLLQDGHELLKIHPPRDLTSWRNTKVGELVHNTPVVLESLEPEAVGWRSKPTRTAVSPFKLREKYRASSFGKPPSWPWATVKSRPCHRRSFVSGKKPFEASSRDFLTTLWASCSYGKRRKGPRSAC
jgi:hypothetical protein